MKLILNNPYGYKICYTKKRFKKLYIIDFKTHSFKGAMKIKRECVTRRDKKRSKKTWLVLPITKSEVKRGIWKRPF